MSGGTTLRTEIGDAPGLPAVGITQAVRVGDLVFVSGQLALDENGRLVGEGDCDLQAERCLQNIEAALIAIGTSRREIVKLVCYLTSKDDIVGYSAAKSRFFDGAPPASTAVVVRDLLVQGALLEVEAVAHAGTTTTSAPPPTRS